MNTIYKESLDYIIASGYMLVCSDASRYMLCQE